MSKIIYNFGENIGDFNCIYIRDVDKKYFKNPARKAWFICPYCGNGFISSIAGVKNGHCKSCGCLHKAITAQIGRNCAKDITNQQFGFLTALYRTEQKYEKRGIYYWKCYCDCGQQCHLLEQDRYCDVILSDLISLHTTKSNKCHLSRGEKLINNILSQLNIEFYTQYKFKDCINPETQKQLLFDFYLPDYNTCIEFDGEQHFLYKNNKGWNTKENFERNQYRDNIKNQYCKNNNINLIRIPYTDINKIDINYISLLLNL